MCTTVIVGNKASYDGSLLMARSADSNALKAQRFLIHPARDWEAGAMYRTADHHGATDFTFPWPSHTFRYTTVPNWQTLLHGAVGFNEKGLGVTATESIFARDDFLAIDPYNKVSGITEDDVTDILLACCETAKEATLLLGKIIEEQGAGEGFGVGIADSKEIWYLETGTGHQWVAARLAPEDYFASANQGRLRFYKENSEDWLASPTLVSFAAEHGFYKPEDGEFDFSAAYTRNDERDRIYNDPRVWQIQRLLNPSLEQVSDDGRNFPVFLKPERPVTIKDLKATMRDHFEGSSHDPYGEKLRGDEPWRPVSVFRTYESHVLQIRPWMPQEIGNVIYLAFGMADLSCYIPMYQGVEAVPLEFGMGTDKADNLSIYWRFRKLQTLVMTDYDGLAPVVKTAFAAFEDDVERRQALMEAEYLKLAETDRAAAQALLQKFTLEIITEVEALIDRLMNECFTLRTESIQAGIFFANRKNKD